MYLWRKASKNGRSRCSRGQLNYGVTVAKSRLHSLTGFRHGLVFPRCHRSPRRCSDLMIRLPILKDELAFPEKLLPDLETRPNLGHLAINFKKRIDRIRQEIRALQEKG